MPFLTYLYGIVPHDAPDPPAELTGIDGAAVTLVRGGRVAGVVSSVASEAYTDELIDSHLSDLDWVGQRGVAHEQVLDWFADRGPVVPLSLFSLHVDVETMLSRLAEDESRYERVLERLRGRREWGVKLWRDEERLAQHLGQLSPAIAALTRDIDEAPPGRRFLLEKKRDELRGDEMRRVSARIAHEVYGQLREVADSAVTVPLPAAAPQAGRALALYGAFLVSEERFSGFQKRLGELAATFQPTGFHFEFTGPWPAYHFAEPDVA